MSSPTSNSRTSCKGEKLTDERKMIFNSEEETYRWAMDFARTLKRGDKIAMYGNLGAGKTVISRGICKGLGFEGNVCSPTYTILHEYPNEPPLFHFDLYRMEPGADFDEIGLDSEYLEKGISLIEWAERLEGDSLEITYSIHIDILSESSREVTVKSRETHNT